MRTLAPGSKSARLNCEALEDRLTPVVGYALSGAAPGAATLLAFDTNSPGTATPTAVTNLAPGETLVGIDFRPQNGLLYGLGVNAGANTGTLYAISVRTGVAAAVGGTGSVALVDAGGVAVDLPDPATTAYGVDFNPAVDRFRVVAGTLNFRINPNTGGPVDGNAGANGANPDTSITPNTLNFTATAYTNNTPNNGNITTQYGLDDVGNALVPLANPNGGTTGTAIPLTLGGAAFDLVAVNGFDIPAGVDATAPNTPVTGGVAFASQTVGGASRLLTINLATGAVTDLGQIVSFGADGAVSGLAIQNDYIGFPAVALDAAGTSVLRFNTANPNAAVTAAITGIVAGDVLVGIDLRPQTGQYYALGVNAGAGTARLYLVTPQTVAPGTDTASVTALGNPITIANLPAGGYGFDFNPSVDRIRVTTASGLNFRLNPNDGTLVMSDGAINGGGSTGVSAAAYTNSFGQTIGTMNPVSQYTLDPVTNTLFIQSPPNSGTQTQGRVVTLGGAPLDFEAVNGFDIPAGVRVGAPNTVATGFGYAVLTVGANTNLYRINLQTGAATNLGAAPAGATGLTLADAPGGVVSFQTTTVSGNEGATVTLTLTRNSGSGPQTVTVTPLLGDADVVGPLTATFVDGATTTTLTVPIVADMLTEGPEAFFLVLDAPGGALGTPSFATLNIADTSLSPPAPPAPPPAPPFYSGASVTGGNLVLTGAGVPGGQQSILLPPGSNAFFSDLNGDGKGDVVLITSGLAVVVDGATGRFLLLIADVTGDGVRDLLVFNADGSTTTTNGLTGVMATTR